MSALSGVVLCCKQCLVLQSTRWMMAIDLEREIESRQHNHKSGKSKPLSGHLCSLEAGTIVELLETFVLNMKEPMRQVDTQLSAETLSPDAVAILQLTRRMIAAHL